jgi:hypothetical protein
VIATGLRVNAGALRVIATGLRVNAGALRVIATEVRVNGARRRVNAADVPSGHKLSSSKSQVIPVACKFVADPLSHFSLELTP